MGLIWEQHRDGVCYQVRRRRTTLELYANGVQHSEFHPTRLITGSVWDLLWLPALLGEPGRLRRVLVLGLGGGTLIPPLRRLLAPEVLVAVELDPLHLTVAREVFQVIGEGVETVEGDAVQWLRDYQGPPFDLIVEDLFAPCNGAVTRAVSADRRWVDTLGRHVSEQGVLVMNFGDYGEFRDSHAASSAAMAGWASRFRLSCDDCYNAVVAFSRQPARSVHLRRRVRSHPDLAPSLRSGRLNYHIRQLN